jgi:hypothetical protein
VTVVGAFLAGALVGVTDPDPDPDPPAERYGSGVPI